METTMIKQETATAEKEVRIAGELVHQGIVSKITSLNSKYGHSWRIEMAHGASYYFNSKTPGLAEKMFTVNSKAAFTCNIKPNPRGGNYHIINQVLFTF